MIDKIIAYIIVRLVGCCIGKKMGVICCCEGERTTAEDGTNAVAEFISECCFKDFENIRF